MSISQMIEEFVTLAIKSGGWMEMDRLYLRNRVMSTVGVSDFVSESVLPIKGGEINLIEELLQVALTNQVIGEGLAEKDNLEAKLGDFLTPPPSVVNALFAQHYETQPEVATDYFYELSQTNHYIKRATSSQNTVFPVATKYGELEIVINASNPEKNTKQLAIKQKSTQVSYPKCLLCMENEGYEGRANYASQINHRLIRMNLEGESWGFQYSPTPYYREESIFLSENHQPMALSEGTFRRLLNIVEVFPHYFVAANADLPIVGDRFLGHDHYRGGRDDFGLTKAPLEKEIALGLFKDVQAGIVKWPLSVIRLRSNNKQQLIQASHYILEQWKHYSDASLEIRAFSEDGTPQHTMTTIARIREGQYELDLVLRDNNVSLEHPEGIFQPHRDVQHIKKEAIGLMEVMGLAILPARLKVELDQVKAYLLGDDNQIATDHIAWADQLKSRHQVTKATVQSIVQQEVGQVFTRILEDAGVFKRDTDGQAGLARFIATL